jgi:hypothetical protein
MALLQELGFAGGSTAVIARLGADHLNGRSLRNMRLSLSVNGAHPIIASVSGPGFLGAHLNIHDRPKEDDHSIKVQMSGHQTAETETISMSWPTADLNVGDVVELRILPEGEGDVPAKMRKSSEAPSNLFSNTELAKEMLQVVSDFENRLGELLSKSEKVEPPDEHKKFGKALVGVAYAIGELLLSPVYRRHKELIPEKLKGELL